MHDFHAERIKNMPTSIFSTISALSVEHKAVNLGQGFPDFDGPSWIMDEAYDAMKSGKNQYAPYQGIYTLRKAISEVQKKHYGLDWNPETEITITAGATEALFSAMNALINPGDEVILFEPYYDSYCANVQIAGGKAVFVTLHKPDFSFRPEELEAAITSKTKLIVVNTPHNPTGKVFSREELEIIAKLAIKHNLLVLSDEVYEFLLFDGAKHIPITSLEGMRERTVTVSSSGKTFGMTGWKIGFTMANESLTDAVRKVHQWTTFAVNTPAQHAMAFAFSRLDGYLPDFRELYLSRRDLIYSLLKETKFNPIKPEGSYFIMAEIPGGIFENDSDAAIRLIKEYGVATIPPSVFYSKSKEGETMLRLCFAKGEETIREGISRLAKVGA
ncbi:MAG: pyridoxal phosphate-dependent aminotransferase [Chloroflexota bacterium]